MSSFASSPFKVRTNTFITLASLILFLVFALFSLLSALEVHNIAQLSAQVRREQLPLIGEAQRSFVNVEGLRRFAAVVYFTNDDQARRHARIDAQAMAAESMYYHNPEFHARAQQLARSIGDLSALRERAQDQGRTMRLKGRDFALLLGRAIYHAARRGSGGRL